MRLILVALTGLFFCCSGAFAQSGYTLEKIADKTFAALVESGSVTSNALVVEGRDFTVVAGAHFSKKAIDDLVKAVAEASLKPIRYFVLTHHHQGYSYIDFDFPPGTEVMTSWQTWQALENEARNIDFPVVFYNEGMTLKLGLGYNTIILTNIGKGHTAGDTLVMVPEVDILFAGDLLYVDSVGYMGDGYMQDWVLALEFMEQLGPRRILPGSGPISEVEDIRRFKRFFRDFLTEVLKHIERGDDLEQTLRSFSLPKYKDYDGYERLLESNIRRAYRELQESFTE